MDEETHYSHGLYGPDTIEWKRSAGLTPFPVAESFMQNRALEIAAGTAREMVWLLEHPPLYTAGTSANINDLISPDRFEVFKTGRGGQYTYHGPGQRVAYVMLDLRKRGRDVSAFVRGLELWIINSLSVFDIETSIKTGRVGVWVTHANGREEKIAAIGVRLKKWVSFHGISINLNPDLGHFNGIVPCGISEHGVTSLHKLGKEVEMEALDTALEVNFQKLFGQTAPH